MDVTDEREEQQGGEKIPPVDVGVRLSGETARRFRAHAARIGLDERLGAVALGLIRLGLDAAEGRGA